MYGYQIEGLNWLLNQRNRKMTAILADDPGLGKTIQTIAFLSAIYYSTVPDGLRNSDAASSNRGTFPFLVVVPAKLVDNWLAEFRKWAPFLTVTTLFKRAAKRKNELRSTIFRKDSSDNLDLCCHVLVTNYKAFCHLEAQKQFRKADITWEAAVFDESDQLNNDQTTTYKTLDMIKAHQRVILTSAPFLKNIDELLSLLSFVIPDERESLGQPKAQFGVDSMGVDMMHDKLRPYMLRRLKAGVQLIIPPKYEINLPISLSKLQNDLYSGVLENNAHTLQRIARALHRHSGQTNNGMSASVGSTLNILMELRRIISHPCLIDDVRPAFGEKQEEQRQLINMSGKLQLLYVLIPELRARGHRILLFGQFKGSLIILEDYFAYAEIKYVCLDADTPQQQRQSIVNDFNAPDSDILLFMATTRTTDIGLNLTSANVVIIYDSDFNPRYNMQAIARAHRIGQTKPVLVFKLIVLNSVEKRILEASTRRLAQYHLIMRSVDNEYEELV
ncbi:hypothetical protein GGI15_002415 [Coemansia interrupta]|uniref:P-loop containing nucleoside triphosphate hydrolase protein n=1 Tax=Coemansia interrupta TaxID=1126814 RepID=A0A9W8HFA8_9FUNG|nr:hypothetical protein GGI15_002415 [Coemansia interrupta]